MRHLRNPRGAVTVEMLGTLPIWVALFLLFWQIVAVGIMLVRAEAAAYAGARVAASGHDPTATVQRIAGDMFGSLDRIERSDCEVLVTITLKAPIVMADHLGDRAISIQKSVSWPSDGSNC